MQEEDWIQKLFIGGLNILTNEKELEEAFGKFDPIMEDQETNKIKGFAFNACENPEVLRLRSGIWMQSLCMVKTSRVEEANKSSLEKSW